MCDIVSGAEISLGERQSYAPSDLSLLLQAMKETLPRLLTAFSASDRAVLRDNLRRRSFEFREIEDVERLDEMIRMLEPARKPD